MKSNWWLRFQFDLCRELGYTLAELQEKETVSNVLLWKALREIEHEERREKELANEAVSKLSENKGRFTGGIRSRN